MAARELGFQLKPREKPAQEAFEQVLSSLLPDHGEMDDRLHGFLHVLNACPFEPGVNGVFTCKDVGAGQSHE